MIKIIAHTTLFTFLFCAITSGQLQQAGEPVAAHYASPHPYAGSGNSQLQLVWSETIKLKGAYFVMVHFKQIKLSSEDYLVVKNPSGDRSWRYSNNEIKQKGNEFWSIHIYGETLEIEIYSKNKMGAFGYEIDMLQKGFHLNKTNHQRSICGSDDTKEAVCYQTSHPTAFSRSNPVARLMVIKNGMPGWGTGWLVGADNQLMTNEHVITNQAEANNTTYEFMAQSSNCGTSCNSTGACVGAIFATSATFIKDDEDLDYCIVKLPNQGQVTASSLYGYLQLRFLGATTNERIYIPQHPDGWGKRIAMFSTHPDDPGYPIVQSVTESGCGSSPYNEVGYWADTQPGSSGSPVLGYSDNLVIALHHCGHEDCDDVNLAVPIQNIIADAGSALHQSAIYFCPNSQTATSNVNSGGIDLRQAAISITAQNTISTNATASYHAGNYLELTDGFQATAGSSFKAYIEGCN